MTNVTREFRFDRRWERLLNQQTTLFESIKVSAEKLKEGGPTNPD